MGIKNMIAKAGGKAADKVAKLAVLSPEQLQDIQERRDNYLAEVPNMNDSVAEELTKRLLSASSIEIYNEYLRHLQDMYVPVKKDTEYGNSFRPGHNIRFIKITKWVTDKKENSLEKLVNVYEVLSNEECNIALVFHRSCEETDVYLAVTNTKNAEDNVDVDNYRRRLSDAIKGNFPGSEWSEESEKGVIPCLKNSLPYSVASASNIPGEKSEKFISQTIEKLLDGIVPDDVDKEYILILLATPITDVEDRKLHLAELYSALAPYAGWQTNFTYVQSDATNSSATFGVNAGVSAGVQHGQNSSVTNTSGTTESENNAVTDTTSNATSDSTSNTNTTTTGDSTSTSTGKTTSSGTTHTEGVNESTSTSGGGSVVIVNAGKSKTSGTSITDAITDTIADTVTDTATKSTSQAVAETVGKVLTSSTGKAITNSLGKAVTNSVAKTAGISKAVNLGGNFGANFARSSNVTATVGKNEGITQSFVNYNIKHTLEILEEQMKRYEQSTALGMWDFAAYVMSEDQNVANNVAHSYLALTQGEQSYMTQTSVNLWRGDMGPTSDDAKEICAYLRELRHPIFGLSPALTAADSDFYAYPSVVTAATSLSGKELALSLNFPQKSIAGLPVIECAEFGRNVVRYDQIENESKIQLGNIFHMNHSEAGMVSLSKESLASHTFITGSTGSGKSNTVYQLIDKVTDQGAKFLVIEPAKGEYKMIFGMDHGVSVYGTNPAVSPLLKLNPFSFAEGIHVFEHIDRLVEIFNVCWPMYAAMPAVLKNAIVKSYEDCGWDMINSYNPYGDKLFPSFTDVARNIRQILDSSEYDAENKGAYKGSLLTRLESLTNGINGLIFTADEIASKNLFDKNCIVDLSRVGSSETKSLLMGMLVLKLQEYRMSTATSLNVPFRHITILEEAHNLLKRSSVNPSAEGANLVGKSVEMISNAIAEMRTYGEGFVIVDQAPGLLDMASIRNTNTKIIMRLPDQGDRELVGKAANLNDDQITELAKLPRGVAAIYQNEWVQPVLCKVDKHESGTSLYEYNPEVGVQEIANWDDRLYIATLITKGSPLGREIVMTDIRNRLKQMHIPASVQVDILRTLVSPPKNIQMVNLGNIMNALFPDITEAVRDSYKRGYDPEEWTVSAEHALQACIDRTIDDQTRRDIIQGILTYYLFTEIRNEAALTEWRQKGNLR